MLDMMAARLDEGVGEGGRRRQGVGAQCGLAPVAGGYVSRPTLTIEGLVGGYSGPGGKTILPHRMTAKLDMRLVPDMTPEEIIGEAQGAPRQARLRGHRSGDQWRLELHQHHAQPIPR